MNGVDDVANVRAKNLMHGNLHASRTSVANVQCANQRQNRKRTETSIPDIWHKLPSNNHMERKVQRRRERERPKRRRLDRVRGAIKEKGMAGRVYTTLLHGGVYRQTS